MENVFSPAVTDSVKSAAKDAQKLGQDVKSEFKDAVSRGRGIADHLASDARTAADDLSGAREGGPFGGSRTGPRKPSAG